MKKAQIEIVGLSVIIIILAVGLVIALTFILRPKTDTLEDQRQNIRATALLNTLIKTNTNLELNGDEERLKDKIKQCYSSGNGGSPICAEIKNDVLNKIFTNQEYILKIQQNFDREITISNPPNLECSGDQVVTDPVVIVAAPKMTVTLTLCSPQF